MAQLSDDCFAFGGKLLSIDEARRIVAANVGAVAHAERVPLAEADGRVLAEDVSAPIDLPPFANSAVDGYAVAAADLIGESVLTVEGRLAAGMGDAEALRPGTARRIFTGAQLPRGADTVFMQEDVRLDEAGRVHLPAGLKPGANTRPRGEDIAAGLLALRAGRRLRPQDLALAAALGLRELPVRRAVRVALFSTGNELTEPGARLGPGKLYDSNRVLLAAMAARTGAAVSDLGILPDDRARIGAAIADAARGHDLILTSGGVSTGEEDHVRVAVEAAGRLLFWRLAIKPGRPVAMGTVAGVPLVGLPGNPVAAFVTFAQIARPLIFALQGAAWRPEPSLPVRAAFAYRKKAGRREYVRVRLEQAPDGGWEARKHPRDGAGLISSLTETDGLAEIAEPVTAVAPGVSVGFLPYSGLL
jgi:molybdopterin molybdotransferase